MTKVKFYFAGAVNWGVARVIQTGSANLGDLKFVDIDSASYEYLDDGFLSFTVRASDTRSFGNTSLTVPPSETVGIVQFEGERVRYNIEHPVFFNEGALIHFFCSVQSSDLLAE